MCYFIPFFGFWWIFPLMFIFCMVMMFLMMGGMTFVSYKRSGRHGCIREDNRARRDYRAS